MNIVFMISIILKGAGALLEVLLQILITGELGVSGFGSYSTCINAADLIFWVMFSGLVKCNTFYLSVGSTSIRSFKAKYYTRYVLPVLALGAAGVSLAGKPLLTCVILITALELVTFDRSSVLITQGQPVTSLIGEYVLGRVVLVIGVCIMKYTGVMSLNLLIALYVFQYILVIAFFIIRKSLLKQKNKDAKIIDMSSEVSLKKWGSYQWADLMYSMIGQMPVVLQYFFAGAFEAGVVSIVLLVKKLINFISGPTAKIFLPEFSRLYRNGDSVGIRKCYASIMRMQMLFVGPLAVVLIAYPNVILKVLADELMGYVGLFVLCSVVFLLSATLGPCGGILQMTGNEKADNHCREISLAFMVVIMILFRKDSLFVLYGLCAQTAAEAVLKYTYMCRWMKKAPTGLFTYLRWWIVPVIAIALTYVLKLQNSILWMIVFAGVVFVFGAMNEFLSKDGCLSDLRKNISEG